MKNKPNKLWLAAILGALIAFGGCTDNRNNHDSKNISQNQQKPAADDKSNMPKSEKSEYDILTVEEKEIYNSVKKCIESNRPYKALFSTESPQKGVIKYDFNNDGKIERLEYTTKIGKNEYGYKKVESCRILYNGVYIEQVSAGEDISSFGIIDSDKKDNQIEFFITEGLLRGGVSTVYRLSDKNIEKIGSIDAGIEAVSGDGKVYYWGGNLYEPYTEDGFIEDLVLSYYDIHKKAYVDTKQIIGKTITSDRKITVYSISEAVPSGAPMTQEEIEERTRGKVVKKINENEKYQVLDIDGSNIKIKTEDGKTGWIGGFHMVWD